jgi:hypothetical protein
VRLAAIEIKGLSMQQCLPLAYDIQLPQDTVLVSNGKATASPSSVRRHPWRAGSQGFARTLRVIENDTDPSQGPWGHPVCSRPSQREKDGAKKPSSIVVDRKAAS